MRTSSRWLSALLLATSLVAGSACAVQGRATVRTVEPPPPRVVVVQNRSGYVWVNGYWDLVGDHWMWRDGYYERERPGYVYIQGRWAYDGGRRRYLRGGWQAARPGHVWVPGSYVTVRGRAEWREGYWSSDRRVIDRRNVRNERRRVIDRRD
jgi:hypothetical protein